MAPVIGRQRSGIEIAAAERHESGERHQSRNIGNQPRRSSAAAYRHGESIKEEASGSENGSEIENNQRMRIENNQQSEKVARRSIVAGENIETMAAKAKKSKWRISVATAWRWHRNSGKQRKA